MAPSFASLPSFLLLLAAALLPTAHVAEAGRGLLQAPLVKDVSEFCSVQRRPFRFVTHLFPGQVARGVQIDYCHNLYPNLGTVTGTTTETALPGGGRFVQVSITATNVFAVGFLNDATNNRTYPLLGADFSVGDQSLDKLTPRGLDISPLYIMDSGDGARLYGCRVLILTSERPDADARHIRAAGSPFPSLLDLDANIDDLRGVATGPIRQNSYQNVAVGTPGQITVVQVSVAPSNPGDLPPFTDENVDLSVLSPNPGLQAQVQAVLAQVTTVPVPALLFLDEPAPTSAPGGTCNPTSNLPNQCYDATGTVFVCCPGSCGANSAGDPQCA
ncbi:hypothetical protein KFL_000110340 [Klebsormidium nitens]|uniref:Uncharacterized protein n=1 Tax=Klebsormidium nitens TaxID=105231 RepID=A0A1Y1HP34_KLENI|nr:hypothetical protein KFL_000110340 [Klebsormidium nitens]|eukprot:GAQ78337.1 hypothetical protein KFL_000110340 [Klebsormidium nitens]